ncbi:MAG TPA: hydrolase, partial [Burkholderiaceae bacterium]
MPLELKRWYQVSIAVLTALCCAHAQAQQTELRWHGHAAYSLKTPSGKVLLIDPWLSNPLNPAAKDNADPLAALGKV